MQTELEPTRFWKDTGQYIFILPDAQNKKKTTTGCKEDQIYFTRCLKIRTWVFFFYFIPVPSIHIPLIWYISMKLSQIINTIIKDVNFIIKTWERNFTDIIIPNSMQITLNYFHIVSSITHQTTHQHILLCLILSTTFLLIPFIFLVYLWSIITKQYISII